MESLTFVMFLFLDSFLRRILLPLALLSAVTVRYNLFSFIYFLFFVVGLVIPSPRLKSQKFSALIFLVLLLGFSLLFVLAQTFFQISIPYIDWSNCHGLETVLRQVGLVQFNLPVSNVLRLLLPDVIVLLTCGVTFVINVKVVSIFRSESQKRKEGEGRERLEVEGEEENGVGHSDGDEMNDPSRDLIVPPFPASVQCYLNIPAVINTLLDLVIFVFLGLAGIAVPSITSFVYYASFLLLLFIWSIHKKAAILIRILRTFLVIYASCHMIVLDLYQFQSAQFYIPLLPDNATSSILARLFGLTPLVTTDCVSPASLLLTEGFHYVNYISPAVIVALLWLLATDLRLWIFTPASLAKRRRLYYLAIMDHTPSPPSLVYVTKGNGRDAVAFNAHYGAINISSSSQASSLSTDAKSFGKLTDKLGHYQSSWSHVSKKISYFFKTVFSLFLNISYIFALISMMIWSVFYPTATSLVFLIWACVIWLIPKVNPGLSLLLTSPLLVLYALALLLLQYTYSLDLSKDLLPRDERVVLLCKSATEEGCKTYVLFIKTCCSVTFFAAFHEFLRLVRARLSENRQNDDGDQNVPLDSSRESPGTDTPDFETPEQAHQRAATVKVLKKLVGRYWIIMVAGAFLLVSMSGDPGFIKTIYMMFFFFFMLSYQITRHWFKINFLFWWFLILYATLDLILLYTYQFDSVRERWTSLYNNSNLAAHNISETDLYGSIGLQQIDRTEIRSVFVSLIPPAIFIAVMAVQLRYFSSSSFRIRENQDELESSTSAFDLTTLVPDNIRNALQNTLNRFGTEEEEEEEEEVKREEEEKEIEEGGIVKMKKQSTLKRQGTIIIVPSKFSRFFSYLITKTRATIVYLVIIAWRFLELHLHKIICLTLFAAAISQISVFYLILLVFVILILPLPYMNPLTFPLVTLYLGFVTLLKMIFQTPIVRERYLNFPDSNSSIVNCSITEGDVGETFNYTYSPLGSDSNWLGLHKTDHDFAGYVSLPIVCVLLLSMWFSVRRSQWHKKGVVINKWESGALFFKVQRSEAEVSVWAAFRYLVNHLFEMYGIEICWCMLAITVAVRVDVYGVVYTIALAFLLLVPRKLVCPAWLFYLILHGLLLVFQYIFLLGAPPEICLTTTGTVYPWSSFNPSGLKKWTFLPADNVDILDKKLLYADFLVYIVVCLQMGYFRNNPLRSHSSDHFVRHDNDFLQFNFFIDYIKYFLFQYFFWISLFLIFFTAVSRVSLLGVFYLLIIFYFVYRGQEMLKESRYRRHFKWSFLRWFSLGIMFIRVVLQIVNCVTNPKQDSTILILLFNGACTKDRYYGVRTNNSQASNIGLWVDTLNFVVITLQIVIFNTGYADTIKDDLFKRENEAVRFRDVFDEKIHKRQEKNKVTKEIELKEIKNRASALGVTGNIVDHLLYVGVRLPKDVELAYSRGRATSPGAKDNYFDISKLTDPKTRRSASASRSREEEEEEKEEEEKEEETPEVGTLAKINNWLLYAVDTVTDWLEESSALYHEVVDAVKLNSVEEIDREKILTIGGDGDTGAESGAADSSSVDASPAGDGNSAGENEGMEIQLATPRSASISEGGGIFIVRPSEDAQRKKEIYEAELKEKATVYTSRTKRLLISLYYAFLAHSDYVTYFLIILNIILNGSILSLFYAVLLFSWGLLSIPWPSKRFWLSLIFYTMSVLIVKYSFQFKEIAYWSKFSSEDGLYPPRVIGIQKHDPFFQNAAWDMLLLITILIHRSLLKQYGLWRDYKSKKPWTELFRDIKIFLKSVINPDISLGTRDYYVVMLVFDILCFVTIILGLQSLGVAAQGDNGVTALASFISSNNIPIPFVFMLLLQFLSMLVDRAIYLRHSVRAKLIFQFILLIVWHIWLFFILPSMRITNTAFIENRAAQFIYFFKACYFIVSSHQIVAGYPLKVISNLLTKNNNISWAAFNVYRVIPILPELREVMDWVFTDTSLSLINWLKVQEIYAQLYLVTVQRIREKNSPRDLGEKQSLVTKILYGIVLLTAFVLLIWGPLLVFSFLPAANISNPPTEVNIKVNLGGFEPLVELTAQNVSLHKITPSEYREMISFFTKSKKTIPVNNVDFDSLVSQGQLRRDDFTRVKMSGNSTSLWGISPPARELLVKQLENLRTNPNLYVVLDFSWTISRTPDTELASNIVSGSNVQELRYSKDNDTIEMFLESLNSTMVESRPVDLNRLFPLIIQAPDKGESKKLTLVLDHIMDNVSYVNCFVNMNTRDGYDWWSLNQNLTSSPYLINKTSQDDFIEMIIYSDRVTPAAFSLIAGQGIIWLYISVVLVIGTFIRKYISELPSRLIMNEILYPELLVGLCKDILLVRESKEFRLEEILVGKLFNVIRSPQKVIALTERPKLKRD